MRVYRTALTILTVIAIAGGRVSHSQGLDYPDTIGEIIGGEVTKIVAAWGEARRARGAFEREITKARREFFECFPDCPDLESRKGAFADILTEKDSYYLYMSLLQRQDTHIGAPGASDGGFVAGFEMMVGQVDGGIYHGCKLPFDAWASAVYEGMGGGIIAFKTAQDVLPAIEANTRLYDEYAVCRDIGELELKFGFTPVPENPGLRRSALVVTEGIKALKCEYGPFENTTGSRFHEPYEMRTANYNSPAPGETAVCCPSTHNEFFWIDIGKKPQPSCKESVAAPVFDSKIVSWNPKNAPKLIPGRYQCGQEVCSDADGNVVCVYANDETVKFEPEQLARVWGGKCPSRWAPEFPVDYEELSSNEIRYTYTNGETVIRKNWRRLSDYWIADEQTWWRIGDPEAQVERPKRTKSSAKTVEAPVNQSDSQASEAPDKTQRPEPPVASADTQPPPDAPGTTAESSTQEMDASENPVQPSQESSAKSGEQVVESMQEVRFDVIGIELGMSVEEAQAIVRNHMATTSVYRNERRDREPLNFPAFPEKPFERAVTFLRLPGDHKPTEVSVDEIVTLVIERSPSGQDEVLGIRRLVSVPQSSSPDSVAALLAKKYGQPASESISGRSTSWWSWGNADKRYCKVSLQELNLREGELESGEAINTWKLGKLPAGSVGTTDTSWMKLPDESRFKSCGPALRAQFSKGKLEVLLTDLNLYFQRFEELFVSPSEQEAHELDLSL